MPYNQKSNIISRAAQKDESYIVYIKSELADIGQRLFGKLTITNNTIIASGKQYHTIEFLIA